MKKLFFKCLKIVALMGLIANTSLGQVLRPKTSAETILQRILAYKSLSYDLLAVLPVIKFASETSLVEFQTDIEPQWGFKPDAITNAFVWKLNRIYLLDEANYYISKGRCIDDSLAHELTHFIQYKYRGWDLNDESLEWDAIDTQTWYRETYCQGNF